MSRFGTPYRDHTDGASVAQQRYRERRPVDRTPRPLRDLHQRRQNVRCAEPHAAVLEPQQRASARRTRCSGRPAPQVEIVGDVPAVDESDRAGERGDEQDDLVLVGLHEQVDAEPRRGPRDADGARQPHAARAHVARRAERAGEQPHVAGDEDRAQRRVVLGIREDGGHDPVPGSPIGRVRHEAGLAGGRVEAARDNVAGHEPAHAAEDQRGERCAITHVGGRGKQPAKSLPAAPLRAEDDRVGLSRGGSHRPRVRVCQHEAGGAAEQQAHAIRRRALRSGHRRHRDPEPRAVDRAPREEPEAAAAFGRSRALRDHACCLHACRRVRPALEQLGEDGLGGGALPLCLEPSRSIEQHGGGVRAGGLRGQGARCAGGQRQGQGQRRQRPAHAPPGSRLR